jgi:hypothetical protein
MHKPYGIFKYDVNALSTYIAYQTNTSLPQVKQKSQIKYIDNYLANFTDNPIYVVYESEYIDQHYLNDYTAYYVTCFNNYKKHCSRIHLFMFDTPMQNDDTHVLELEKALGAKSSQINNKNYLGYIVLRPIPQTFLAKVCLKPYNNDYRVFSSLKNYNVSLFGIALEVKTIAAQEQDRILSACATTSLWSFFHSHPNKRHTELPSSSAITKSAYPQHNGYEREFPNSGLSTDMICRVLRVNNLAPENYQFHQDKDAQKNTDLFKEMLYSYISSGLPLILSVSVSDNGRLLGSHAVTVVGCSLDAYASCSKMRAHRLNKIYVHDDRHGPFMRLKIDKTYSEVLIDTNLEASNTADDVSESYSYQTLTIGIYHKVRIKYAPIKSTCLLLCDLLVKYAKDSNNSIFTLIESLEWDIKIIENAHLKQRLLKSEITNKASYLTASWPKYIWSAQADLLGNPICTILFDATDFNHGDVFLHLIPMLGLPDAHVGIDDFIKDFCKLIDKAFHNDTINSLLSYSNKNDSIYILRSMVNAHNRKTTKEMHLDELYGPLNAPRGIKPEEILKNDDIHSQLDHRLYKRPDDSYFKSEISNGDDFTYIWVIDEDGALCLGKEKKGENKGHPTLINARHARIAGEICYHDGIWRINTRSGRYSYSYSKDEKNEYLLNAITYKFELFFPELSFKACESRET